MGKALTNFKKGLKEGSDSDEKSEDNSDEDPKAQG